MTSSSASAKINEWKKTPRIVVVGAGPAGVATGIALKEKLQYHNFTIYEKADNVGGTWRDHIYPGCGCDIAAHWYSLSSDLNPSWSSYFVRQPEILAYWKSLWTKHDLRQNTVLNTSVVSAEWDETAQVYHVTTENESTGQRDYLDAEIMIYAIGIFKVPLYPKDIQGLEVFKGELFHSARWKSSVTLKGKRVAVIGNGCSGAQLLPEIALDPSTTIVNFCRSPQWFIGQKNYRYPQFIKWILANIPGIMRAYRNFVMASYDSTYVLHSSNIFLRSVARLIFTRYMKSVAPREYWDKLIPNFAVGCKRTIIDTGYLKCLSQDNVTLRWDEIDRVVADGIKTKSGEVLPFDVIIFATGYSVDKFNCHVRGRGGKTVQEYYDEQGGLHAYLGMAMPGFPNLFNLWGPNVATSHASIIFSQEAQIQLALQLMKPIIKGKAMSFEIKEQVVDDYNAWLQNRLAGSVWADCSSYYHSDRDKGKLIAIFPGPVTWFWYLARKPRWNQWIGVADDAWRKRLKAQKWERFLATGLAVIIAVLIVLLRSQLLGA